MNIFSTTILRRTVASAVTVCGVLGLLGATAASAAPVTLHWTANSEPTLAGYLVSYGTAPGQYATTVDVGNTPTFAMQTPNNTAIYYFAVQAYDTEGQASGYSAEVSTAGLVAALRVTALTANRVAPQAPGTAVTFTAAVTGGTAPYAYKFWILSDTTPWTVAQAWSSNATFTWTPATAGTYQVAVWVRSAGSTVDASEGATGMGSLAFRIATSVKLAATLTAAKASPQAAGTTVTVATAATGGTAPYAYKFWIMSNVAAWSIAQDWSASPTLTWTPAVAASYQIVVWVRSAGSKLDAASEASAGLGFRITAPVAPLAATSLTANRPSPQVAGTAITVATVATGGTAPYAYKFWVLSDTTPWTMVRTWSTSATFVWTPPTSGTYQVAVWVRSATSTVDAPETPAAVRSLAFTISPKP